MSFYKITWVHPVLFYIPMFSKPSPGLEIRQMKYRKSRYFS